MIQRGCVGLCLCRAGYTGAEYLEKTPYALRELNFITSDYENAKMKKANMELANPEREYMLVAIQVYGSKGLLPNGEIDFPQGTKAYNFSTEIKPGIWEYLTSGFHATPKLEIEVLKTLGEYKRVP